MRRVLVMLLFLSPVLLRAETKWTYAASDHFEVYTTGGDRHARDALVYFERVHAFFTDFMKMSPKTARPTRLIVFSGDREFKPYRPNEVAAAFYQAGPDRDYIVMRSLDQDSYPIVIHEYAHLVIRHSGDHFPIWLNEGLAEFFSTLESAPGGKMNIGRVPMERLEYLNGQTLIPVARLLAVEHDSPEYNKEAHAGTFYSESWALVHMLMTDQRYRPKAQQFLAQMDGGSRALDAFQTVYNKGVSALESDLSGYIRKQAYIYFSAPYKEQKAFDKAPVRIADGFEAGLVTANLLAATRDREAEARAAFEALAKQKPEDVSLLESRGYFELRRGHREEALPLMARAVELGSGNGDLYRDYALIAPIDDSRRESLLARAVALSPDDIRTRIMLASAQVRLRKGAPALETLAPITRVKSEDAYELFVTLAGAQATERHWNEAVAAATSASKYARTAQQTTDAERLVLSINQIIAATKSSVIAPPEAAALAGRATDPTPSYANDGRVFQLEGKPPPTVEVGRLKNMICGSSQPTLEIQTATGLLRLLIDDPLRVQVLGRDGKTVDLNCGTQDVPVRVGYEPASDPARKTDGILRMLDFGQK